MPNIWKQNRDVTQHPNRNNFDLSFQSHSTFKFGYLYPVFCRRVVPGDSFRIDSAFDLKMMPVAFPVQSRIRAHMHYFYVRNKNLWKNWEDWISGLKSNSVAPHPYISRPDSEFETGSIHDFLNQPTTVVTDSAVSSRVTILYKPKAPDLSLQSLYFFYNGHFDSISSSTLIYPGCFFKPFVVPLKDGSIKFSRDFDSTLRSLVNSFVDNGWGSFSSYAVGLCTDVDFDHKTYRILGSGQFVNNLNNFILTDSNLSLLNSSVTNGVPVSLYVLLMFSTAVSDSTSDFFVESSSLYAEAVVVGSSGHYEWSELGLPFYSSHVVPLNALKYRAYESIYRAFYASDVWQPLVLNGNKEYNKFITTDDDGEDTTDYHLFKRNYELDFLTSALPSPQAGVAPMVGISALGEVTIEDENGITTGRAEVDNDGTITKIAITSPLASVDHARTAANIAMLGMNINDFRAANSLQRLLEQTMRSGYRYVNFVKGHFGVEPKYVELDMPEFIGGYSRDVQISTVVSQSDTAGLAPDAGKNLGDFGGIGRVVGGSNHSVSHYCDDYGWIMGIMSITPTPAYSQLLPKENICPSNYLDYYFPEMSQVGMQPVPYTEVAPLQAYLDSLRDPDKKITDVFGYQRPNYDMVASVDEVHGQFRSSLKDMLIHRIFDGRPELGSSFLEVDPSEVNDIFINQNPDEDVFIGHIAFNVTPKRPFPRVHIPGIR